MNREWNGIPDNPGRDGEHWIAYYPPGRDEAAGEFISMWYSTMQEWDDGDDTITPTTAIEKGWRYLGPVKMPHEVDAIIAERDRWREQLIERVLLSGMDAQRELRLMAKLAEATRQLLRYEHEIEQMKKDAR